MYAHLTRLLFALAATLLAASAAASSATAATVNVDVQSLGGRCSDSVTADVAQDPATPWCTVAKALNAAPDGTLVVVRDGTYDAASVTGRHLVTGISVAAAPGEQPLLRSVSLVKSDRFTFSGFALQ